MKRECSYPGLPDVSGRGVWPRSVEPRGVPHIDESLRYCPPGRVDRESQRNSDPGPSEWMQPMAHARRGRLMPSARFSRPQSPDKEYCLAQSQ